MPNFLSYLQLCWQSIYNCIPHLANEQNTIKERKKNNPFGTYANFSKINIQTDTHTHTHAQWCAECSIAFEHCHRHSSIDDHSSIGHFFRNSTEKAIKIEFFVFVCYRCGCCCCCGFIVIVISLMHPVLCSVIQNVVSLCCRYIDVRSIRNIKQSENNKNKNTLKWNWNIVLA